MTDSYIAKTESGTTFAGPDAVNLYRAVMLRSALGMLKVGIKPNRAYTLTNVLRAAGEITGKAYKGKKDIERARADLKLWADTMNAALPHIEEKRT